MNRIDRSVVTSGELKIRASSITRAVPRPIVVDRLAVTDAVEVCGDDEHLGGDGGARLSCSRPVRADQEGQVRGSARAASRRADVRDRSCCWLERRTPYRRRRAAPDRPACRPGRVPARCHAPLGCRDRDRDSAAAARTDDARCWRSRCSSDRASIQSSGITVTLCALAAVAELCQPLDGRFVLVETEAAQ